MENFAERLFCDLKNENVKLEKPEFVVDGAKIGMFKNTFQFTIFGKSVKYKFGSFNKDDAETSFTKAYCEFKNAVKSNSNHLKFYSLVLPRKSVIEGKLEIFESVTSRYLRDYLHQSDDVIERWDVLVQKL